MFCLSTRKLNSAWEASRFPSMILRSSRFGNENMLAGRNTAVKSGKTISTSLSHTVKTLTRRRTKQHICAQTSRAPFSNHSHHKMTICGLSLHHGNTESRKNLEQKFNWVHSLHTELMNASHSTSLFTNSCNHISTFGKAPLHSDINHNNPQFLYSL